MRDRLGQMSRFVKMLAKPKLSCRQSNVGIIHGQSFAEPLFAHYVDALIAFFHPVCQGVEVRGRIEAAKILEAVVDEGDLIRPNYFPVLVNPRSGRNVDHVVELGDEMLLVNQSGIRRMGRGNPRPCIFYPISILRHRNDLEILILEPLINCLPTWQVQPAPSPRSPSDEQDLLASKIRERMEPAAHIGKHKIRRLKRRQTFSLVGTQSEVPGAEPFILRNGLLHEIRESDEIKPGIPIALAHEPLLSDAGHGKAELIAANALRLQLKAGGTLEVNGGNPKVSCFFVGSIDF